jgi:two-component system cell cycle sensor histidine kinase/response regulator CckA
LRSERSRETADAATEISVLIDTLVQTEERLEEATLGEVDSVSDRRGRIILLRRAQDQVRFLEAAKQTSVLNALPASVALVDAQGLIMSVNEAWKQFAQLNGLEPLKYEIGRNYLEVCDDECGDLLPKSNRVSKGIQSILNAEEASFSVEYLCKSPSEPRWYLLTVTPLAGSGSHGAVVMLLDITERKRAEDVVQEASTQAFHSNRQRAGLELAFLLISTSLIYAWACRSHGLDALKARYYEQLDQFIVTMVYFGIGTAIFAFRRWRETESELVARRHGQIALRLLHDELDVRVKQRTKELASLNMSLRSEVTERKRSEEKLRASEASMAVAQHIGHFGSWELALSSKDGRDAKVLRWSDEMFRIAGYELGSVEITRSFFFSLVPEEEHEPINRAMEEAIASGGQFSMVHHFVRPNGERRLIQETAQVFFDETGQPLNLIGTAHDITERTEAEEAFKKSELRYRYLFDNMLEGFAYCRMLSDPAKPGDFIYLEVNGAFEDLTGLKDVVGKRVSDVIPGIIEVDAGILKVYSRVSSTGKSEVSDVFFESLRIWLSIAVYSPEEGYFVAVFDNISERKQSESILRESEERFRKMLENVELLAMTLDMDGNVTFCNDYLLKLTGWEHSEVIGTDWFERFNLEEEREAMRTAFSLIASTGITAVYSNRILTKSGKVLDVIWNNSLISDGSGRVAGLASIGDNVTERKSLQEQLLQSQKMESLGSLAGGIAHDFNNLLTGILGYAELAKLRLPQDSNAQPDLDAVCQSARRAAKLTKQLLSFARKEVVDPQIVDLNVLIGGLENLIRQLVGVDIKLVIRSSADLGRVKLDPSQFEQVLVNLSVNARDAMPHGGTLTIQASNETVDELRETHGGKLMPGHYVKLSVADTGFGMTKDVQARIFDPFFTTKEKGKGTGLGLSTCYGIVTNSGGHIWAYSEVGLGTAFHIYFPRVDSPLMDMEAAGKARPFGSGETILVVEDEDTVRTLAAEVLRTAGYHVLHAPDGLAALSLVAGYTERIDLLVTDVVMPGMTGSKLAGALETVRPDMKFLFMSGFTGDASLHEGTTTRPFSFLQKPFSPGQLAQKDREVLDLKAEPLLITETKS